VFLLPQKKPAMISRSGNISPREETECEVDKTLDVTEPFVERNCKELSPKTEAICRTTKRIKYAPRQTVLNAPLIIIYVEVNELA